MQTIADTFCPAKWDELFVSFETNYAYACCKSKPMTFVKDINEHLDQQKSNLLNGVQDSSCEYCWQIERNGNTSLRHTYLKNFDVTSYDNYINNSVTPTLLQVNLGNECNFQCTYCNPKFSSKWEQDVNKQSYKLFTDRYFYQVDVRSKDLQNKNLEFLKSFDKIETLSLVGGEPLYNKKLFEILSSVDAESLILVSNLSADKTTLQKTLNAIKKFQTVKLGVSIDATGPLAEFVRFGLNYSYFMDNLQYVLKQPNITIAIQSLMTSLTIRDIDNLSKVILPLLDKHENLEWNLSYCTDPRIQSLETLQDQYKDSIIQCMESFMDHDRVNGGDRVINVIKTTKFNNTLYNELKQFIREFSSRKNMEISLCLD